MALTFRTFRKFRKFCRFCIADDDLSGCPLSPPIRSALASSDPLSAAERNQPSTGGHNDEDHGL
jgi:hypothetical protein